MPTFGRPWRAILGSLGGLFGGEKAEAWVEPSNPITRAVLAGEVSSLATFTFRAEPALSSTPAAAYETATAPGAAFVPAPPAAWEEPAAPAPAPVEAPRHVFEDDQLAEEVPAPGKSVELAA